jgi:cytochrome c oxidase assembly protein subunit 19
MPDRNLMAPDSFKNLGFGDDSDPPTSANATSKQAPQPHGQDKPRGF